MFCAWSWCENKLLGVLPVSKQWNVSGLPEFSLCLASLEPRLLEISGVFCDTRPIYECPQTEFKMEGTTALTFQQILLLHWGFGWVGGVLNMHTHPNHCSWILQRARQTLPVHLFSLTQPSDINSRQRESGRNSCPLLLTFQKDLWPEALTATKHL